MRTTITHLTPSNVFFPVDLFTVVFALLPLAFRLRLAGFSGGLGLGFFSFNAGFLCVIWDLSTCFKLFVIPSPWLICENTAFMLPSDVGRAAAEAAMSNSGAGGGGGGGGGAGPPVETGGEVDGGGGEVAAVNVGELVPMNVSAGAP
jgi:hypothetical protein